MGSIFSHGKDQSMLLLAILSRTLTRSFLAQEHPPYSHSLLSLDFLLPSKRISSGLWEIQMVSVEAVALALQLTQTR